MKLRKSVLAGLAAISLLSSIAAAMAQVPPPIADAHLMNASGAPAPAVDAAPSTWFDHAYCSTVGYVLVRLTGAWTCSNNQPVNARWVGAIGDGITNDNTALQSCITIAQGLHGSCYIPAGKYLFTSAALSITSHVNIYGDGVQSIAGVCSFNNDCAQTLTVPLIGNATTLIPASTINGITASTNEAVQIHDLQIVYTALPAGGSGLSAIKIAGSGGSFGVNSGSHIWNVMLAQADVLIQMDDAVSWWIDHSVLYNFRTASIGVGGTGIANGNDWSIDEDRILSGPATTNTCYGVLITASAASAITKNKFNFIPDTTNCAAIMYLASTNGTSFEPVRIAENSIEGNAAGIVFFNNCPTPSACSATQTVISANQIWTGAGFDGGPNIYVTGAAAAQWIDQMLVNDNMLSVVGGVSSNVNVSFNPGFVNNVLLAGNLFGNTSAAGAMSILLGSGNSNVKATGNHILVFDKQTLGTSGTAPFALACGKPATNTLYNAVEVSLFGGAGVTAVAKNGRPIISQPSAALSPFSLLLNVGDTMQVTCGTVPSATYAAFNP
jgi:Pectate lyase superfamily protein